MRNLLSLAIMLALPAGALANDDSVNYQERCLISFSGAQQDVCESRVFAEPADLASLMSPDAVKQSTLRIVKFDGPILDEQRQAVELAGARIIGYAPYHAYIVRMEPALDAEMKRIAGVVWAGPMLPALKVDPNIFAELRQGNLTSQLGIETLSMSLDSPQDGASLRLALGSIAGLSDLKVQEVGGELRASARFDRTPAARDELVRALETLALRDDVLSVSFRKPLSSRNSQGHWLHQGNVSAQYPIWNRGIYGCGQIVGELDTGLYVGNVAFNDTTQTLPISVCNSGTSCAAIAENNDHRKVVAYYKWSGASGGSWADGHGHGTHVAGSIIGNDNGVNPGQDCSTLTAPNGTSDLVGMAPYAKLVMQEAGSGLEYLNDYNGTTYHAVDTAYQNGARIHSNSWGGGCTNQFGACISGCTVTYDEFSRDADRVAKDRDDMLVVFAAGNDATACANGNNVGSPGNSKNVLSIGATLRGASGNGMASFSSRGPALDSRTKPDLGAQGNAIVSAGRSASGTATMSGTSMATPTASGLAALVRDYLAQGYYPSGVKTPSDAITAPSGALLKAILTAGAFQMTGTGAGPNPGQAQGFGRILLEDSLYFGGDASHLFLHDEDSGVGTGDVQTHSLTVSAGTPLTVVLTWSDAAAAINASPATVNALRLEVQAPNGDVWTQKLPAGYSVNDANPTQSTTTSNYDNLNNLHRIRLATPEAGTYQIRVRGIAVPQGPQTYALAAVGGFTISMDPTFNLSATPGEVAFCAGSTAQFDVGVRSRYGFTDPVALSHSGLPGAATGSFSLTPVTPADPAATSQLTVANTAGLARGTYAFQILGNSSGTMPLSQAISATLKVSSGVPLQPGLTAPADAAADVPRTPTFTWAADVAAESYTIEVATDAAFTTIVASGTVDTNTWVPAAPLAPATLHYWRVKANSTCGDSGYSATFSFTTGVTFPEPYCTVTFPSAVEPITKVIFTGINNPSSAVVNGSPALEDFLGVSGGLVQASQSYQIAVEGNTAGSYTTHVNAFFDWNRNGTFDAGESYTIGTITNSTGADGKQAVASIAVPASATPGPVRMRVMKKYNAAGTACNNSGYGQAEDYTVMVQGGGPTYTIGGTVSGTSGAGLALKLNGGADFAIASDGAYTFPGSLPSGTAYAVTVSAAPAGQSCAVANGSGTVASANVTNVDVTCVSVPTYTIGGTVSGTSGAGLALKLNGGADFAIAGDGAYTFPGSLPSGTAYAVTVSASPVGQTCSVANGSGTVAGANVTNVDVTCADIPPQSYPVGGQVSGLTVPGLVLALNNGTTRTIVANGTYAFVPGVPTGFAYEVTIQSQPSGVACTVSNGSGTMAYAAVTNVDVSCAAQGPAIFADGFEATP